LVAWLTKSRDFTMKLQAMALHVDGDRRSLRDNVRVIYFKDGAFRRATAKAFIVATPSHVARYLVDRLLANERKAALDEFNTVPAVVANVAMRDMTSVVELGLAHSNYWWGSKYWSNFDIADWTSESRFKPDRQSVLSFYDGVWSPPEEFAAERM